MNLVESYDIFSYEVNQLTGDKRKKTVFFHAFNRGMEKQFKKLLLIFIN